MEEVIAAGRVSVNYRVAQVGERIEPGDELRIDGTVKFSSRSKMKFVVVY